MPALLQDVLTNLHSAAVAANLTQTRALVASLEAAVAFVRALARALPVLTQLLASATVSDVHDAITLLITFSKFGIAGAQDALRKMLPLVFSFDQGDRLTGIAMHGTATRIAWAGRGIAYSTAGKTAIFWLCAT